MPNVRDHDSSIYFKLQGDALCVGGYENDPIFVDDVCLSLAEMRSASYHTNVISRFRKMLHSACMSWTGMFLVCILKVP